MASSSYCLVQVRFWLLSAALTMNAVGLPCAHQLAWSWNKYFILTEQKVFRLRGAWEECVRSYCGTVDKTDGPTVRCDDGVNGDGATVSHDNTANTKAICSIGSCASYVLDDYDLGWTVVNRGSNKSKTKTWHKDLCQEVCNSWKAFIGICANGSGVRLTQWDYFQSWSWSCSNLDLRKVHQKVENVNYVIIC